LSPDARQPLPAAFAAKNGNKMTSLITHDVGGEKGL
jgi:hypothetical protein